MDELYQSLIHGELYSALLVLRLFDHYELYEAPAPPTPSAEDSGRMWRDRELDTTDRSAQTPDWPNRDNILTYRQALRDWPSTSDFPDTKPTLGG